MYACIHFSYWCEWHDAGVSVILQNKWVSARACSGLRRHMQACLGFHWEGFIGGSGERSCVRASIRVFGCARRVDDRVAPRALWAIFLKRSRRRRTHAPPEAPRLGTSVIAFRIISLKNFVWKLFVVLLSLFRTLSTSFQMLAEMHSFFTKWMVADQTYVSKIRCMSIYETVSFRILRICYKRVSLSLP